VAQKVVAYDEDASLSVTLLLALPTCNGRIGTTGMCLGGHLAYRCALDARVSACVCYFATDIHSHSLGEGMQDDSLLRAPDIKGELIMVGSLVQRAVAVAVSQLMPFGYLDLWKEYAPQCRVR
jgi:carboxymethylenebutenolidase